MITSGDWSYPSMTNAMKRKLKKLIDKMESEKYGLTKYKRSNEQRGEHGEIRNSATSGSFDETVFNGLRKTNRSNGKGKRNEGFES